MGVIDTYINWLKHVSVSSRNIFESFAEAFPVDVFYITHLGWNELLLHFATTNLSIFIFFIFPNENMLTTWCVMCSTDIV